MYMYILCNCCPRYRVWLITMEAKSGKISYRVCHLQACKLRLYCDNDAQQ